MGTEIALGRCVAVWVNVERVIRTGLHATLASNAAPAVKIDDAVCATVECSRRTDFDAWRRITMIAAHHAEVPAGVRELTFFDVLYPGAKYPDRHLVLLFARHRAGMTANTSILVDYKAIAHVDEIIL